MLQTKASTTRETRWKREAEHFDSIKYDPTPLPQKTFERYRDCKRPFHSAEYPFAVLGDVRGKRILDVGCGDGVRSILLALKGATVVGVDLSANGIAAARSKARAHGVSDATEFVCCALELYTGSRDFDVIIGWNILHHLISELPDFLTKLPSFGKPTCVYLFHEPVNLFPLLRRIRLALPVPVVGTPDERPLETQEIDLIRRKFEQVDITYFGFAVRLLSRFVLDGDYEHSSWTRRTAHDLLGRFDWLLFRGLRLSKLASTATIVARTGG